MQSLCAALRITLGWVLGGLLFQADYRKASHSWGAMLMVSKDPFLLVRKWTKMHFSLFTLSGEIDCLLLFVVSLCFSGGLQCWMVGARVSTKGSEEAVRQRKEWRLNSIPWSPEGLKWVSCDLKGSCWDLGRGCSIQSAHTAGHWEGVWQQWHEEHHLSEALQNLGAQPGQWV